MSKKRKIITKYDPKPVPSRKYDWEAYREDFDENDLIGFGETEQEAKNSLIFEEMDLGDIPVSCICGKDYTLEDFAYNLCNRCSEPIFTMP